MNLQHVMNTAAKYPWRYGYGSYQKCPLRKMCGARGPHAAAKKLDVPIHHIFSMTQWWDTIFQKDRQGYGEAKDMLAHYGYKIPAAPGTIRQRKKTKRVHARAYLQRQKWGAWADDY